MEQVSYCSIFFFYGIFKRITVFYLSHVSKEYLLMSGNFDGIGDVGTCVKLLVPLVVCEIIILKGI